MALPDDIADLLKRSLFSHRVALQLRTRRQPGADVELAKANALRRDANSLDPTFTAPAWALEEQALRKGINQALLLFYGRMLP